MPLDSLSKQQLVTILEALIEEQENKLFNMGREIIPYLTKEDLLQPNDFNELEFHPFFRYEEGIIEGIKTVRAALYATLQEASH